MPRRQGIVAVRLFKREPEPYEAEPSFKRGEAIVFDRAQVLDDLQLRR